MQSYTGNKWNLIIQKNLTKKRDFNSINELNNIKFHMGFYKKNRNKRRKKN